MKDFIQFLALSRCSVNVFIMCSNDIKNFFLWFLLGWLEGTTAVEKLLRVSLPVFEYVCENV